MIGEGISKEPEIVWRDPAVPVLSSPEYSPLEKWWQTFTGKGDLETISNYDAKKLHSEHLEFLRKDPTRLARLVRILRRTSKQIFTYYQQRIIVPLELEIFSDDFEAAYKRIMTATNRFGGVTVHKEGENDALLKVIQDFIFLLGGVGKTRDLQNIYSYPSGETQQAKVLGLEIVKYLQRVLLGGMLGSLGGLAIVGYGNTLINLERLLPLLNLSSLSELFRAVSTIGLSVGISGANFYSALHAIKRGMPKARAAGNIAAWEQQVNEYEVATEDWPLRITRPSLAQLPENEQALAEFDPLVRRMTFELELEQGDNRLKLLRFLYDQVDIDEDKKQETIAAWSDSLEQTRELQWKLLRSRFKTGAKLSEAEQQQVEAEYIRGIHASATQLTELLAANGQLRKRLLVIVEYRKQRAQFRRKIVRGMAVGMGVSVAGALLGKKIPFGNFVETAQVVFPEGTEVASARTTLPSVDQSPAETPNVTYNNMLRAQLREEFGLPDKALTQDEQWHKSCELLRRQADLCFNQWNIQNGENNTFEHFFQHQYMPELIHAMKFAGANPAVALPLLTVGAANIWARENQNSDVREVRQQTLGYEVIRRLRNSQFDVGNALKFAISLIRKGPTGYPFNNYDAPRLTGLRTISGNDIEFPMMAMGLESSAGVGSELIEEIATEYPEEKEYLHLVAIAHEEYRAAKKAVTDAIAMYLARTDKPVISEFFTQDAQQKFEAIGLGERPDPTQVASYSRFWEKVFKLIDAKHPDNRLYVDAARLVREDFAREYAIDARPAKAKLLYDQIEFVRFRNFMLEQETGEGLEYFTKICEAYDELVKRGESYRVAERRAFPTIASREYDFKFQIKIGVAYVQALAMKAGSVVGPGIFMDVEGRRQHMKMFIAACLREIAPSGMLARVTSEEPRLADFDLPYNYTEILQSFTLYGIELEKLGYDSADPDLFLRFRRAYWKNIFAETFDEVEKQELEELYATTIVPLMEKLQVLEYSGVLRGLELLANLGYDVW